MKRPSSSPREPEPSWAPVVAMLRVPAKNDLTPAGELTPVAAPPVEAATMSASLSEPVGGGLHDALHVGGARARLGSLGVRV